MSGVAKKLMGTTAAGGGFTAIEDVFHTYVYGGNSTNTDVVNGLDLAGEGGMLWHKNRSISHQHYVFDTERGAAPSFPYIQTNDTAAEFSTTGRLVSWNSDGYTIGNQGNFNEIGQNNVIWTFRKAPRFFDVVTYTGNGSGNRAISHKLGGTVGFLVVKRLDQSSTWHCYHQAIGAQQGRLEETIQFRSSEYLSVFHSSGVEPTDSIFYVGGSNPNDINTSGGTYVAYLFAHDPLGPSGDGSDGLIACGSVAGGATVDLGWEPQWVLTKSTDDVGSWWLMDSMRGMPVGGNEVRLQAETSADESALSSYNYIDITSTGFTMKFPAANHIYIAIRRGPMRAPTSGTEVFGLLQQNGTGSTQTVSVGFNPDTVLKRRLNSATDGDMRWFDRLRGNMLRTDSDSEEQGGGGVSFSDVSQDSTIKITNAFTDEYIHYFFQRRQGFFDTVCFTGNGFDFAGIPHNLGVKPEMLIMKRRDAPQNWKFVTTVDGGSAATFNSASNFSPESWLVNYSNESTFTPYNDTSGAQYVAHLFASLAGVQYISFYTGNGSSQTINCGFTSGARLIMIKSIPNNTDWKFIDSARGIVSGSDPIVTSNIATAQDTASDCVDPASSGFIVNQESTHNLNVNGEKYFVWAIA